MKHKTNEIAAKKWAEIDSIYILLDMDSVNES